tara:strand:- start:12 stop:176 length:165 start_codon:yes stop_codon:yes gene_type:complete
MAKIAETAFVVKASKLLRDNEPDQPILEEEMIQQIQAVIQELAGEGTLVEIIKE